MSERMASLGLVSACHDDLLGVTNLLTNLITKLNCTHLWQSLYWQTTQH